MDTINYIRDEQFKEALRNYTKGIGTSSAYADVFTAAVPLTSNSSTYLFDFMATNSAKKTPIDNLIQGTDCAILLGAKLSILKAQNKGGTKLYLSQAVRYTYPEKTVFNLPPTPTNISEWETLEILYNSNLSFNVGTIRPLTLPTKLLKSVPPTQNGANTHAAKSIGAFDGVYAEFEELSMQLAVRGGSTLTVTLDLTPTIEGFSNDLTQIAGDPAVGVNFVALELYGLRLPNGMEFFSKMYGDMKKMC